MKTNVPRISLLRLCLPIALLFIAGCDSDSPTYSKLPGGTATLAPSINIVTPAEQGEFTPGDTIEFSAVVTDSDTDNNNLTVTWTSDNDGLLGSGSPSTNGVATIATAVLTRGQHVIVASVTDSDQNSSSDTIVVLNVLPTGITLGEPIKGVGTVSLSWTQNTDPDFNSYKLYRSEISAQGENGVLIAELTSSSDTTFLDSLPPLTPVAFYQVYVSNTGGYSKESNEREVAKPGGLILNFIPYDAVIYPQEGWLCVLDRRFGADDRIVVIDYNSMREIVSTNINGDVGYMDIGDNGQGVELYLPMDSEGWIKIFSILTLSNVSGISTGEFVASVVIGGNDLVFGNVDPSPWWDYPVRSYDRISGNIIDSTGFDGSFGGGRLLKIPGRNELIEISQGIYPADMDYYRYDASGNFVEHANDSYHGDYPLDASIFRISPNGQFIITALEGAIYSADSGMAYQGALPRGVLEFSDFAFDTTGNIIYAGTSNNKSIKIYSYPALSDNGQIPTRGYPYIIFRDGVKIISLSRTTENGAQIGIDVVEIP